MIWNKLYNFQRDAATGIINKLETYNGCILADSVGLGKTFTALAVIKYYELRNKSVLVLAPKKLADNWTNYNTNLTTNSFARDRFNYDVLATPTSRARAASRWAFRSTASTGATTTSSSSTSRTTSATPTTPTRSESRYQRLMRQVIQQGVKTKVLMLSATPVNNRFTRPEESARPRLRRRLGESLGEAGISKSVEEVFRQRPGGVQRLVAAACRGAHR